MKTMNRPNQQPICQIHLPCSDWGVFLEFNRLSLFHCFYFVPYLAYNVGWPLFIHFAFFSVWEWECVRVCNVLMLPLFHVRNHCIYFWPVPLLVSPMWWLIIASMFKIDIPETFLIHVWKGRGLISCPQTGWGRLLSPKCIFEPTPKAKLTSGFVFVQGKLLHHCKRNICKHLTDRKYHSSPAHYTQNFVNHFITFFLCCCVVG